MRKTKAIIIAKKWKVVLLGSLQLRRLSSHLRVQRSSHTAWLSAGETPHPLLFSILTSQHILIRKQLPKGACLVDLKFLT